jgi:O-antigen ligase
MATDAFAGAAPARRTGYLPVLAGGACSLLGFVAVVEPLAAPALVFGIVFVVVAFRNLAAGLALFSALFALDHVPALAGGLTFVKLAGFVLVAAWLGQILTHRDDARLLTRDRPWLSGAAAALVVWGLASSLWAEDSATALSSAFRLGQGLFLIFIVYSVLREPKHFRWLLAGYSAGALVAAAFAVPSIVAGGERLGEDTANPNELAAYVLPAIMVSAFVVLGERRPVVRWACAAVGLLLLIALLMTGSRAGLVGLAVALVAAVIAAGQSRFKVAAATLVMLGIGVVYFAAYAPQYQVERLSSVQQDRGTGRSDLWVVAGEIVRQEPLKGVGAGNFPLAEARYAATEVDISRIDLVLDKRKVVHNTYLSILSELGFVGLTLFLGIIVTALASLLYAIRLLRGRDWPFELQLRGFLVGLLGILAAYTFSSAEYEKQLWLLVGIALALPSLVSAPQQPEPEAR